MGAGLPPDHMRRRRRGAPSPRIPAVPPACLPPSSPLATRHRPTAHVARRARPRTSSARAAPRPRAATRRLQGYRPQTEPLASKTYATCSSSSTSSSSVVPALIVDRPSRPPFIVGSHHRGVMHCSFLKLVCRSTGL
ncbi:hypothetical protein PVAP13_9KG037400 [Panicum virgatum]|uniref:Uncharacterized protein n=1 Tax=Panicum virgatum TaxID=38727 RepID=A0A8T0NB34_PANVG|nr:hypothetical protein PVAP13_9KG037400 [Panicum virgatum]